MLNRPNKATQKDSQAQELAQSPSTTETQHGLQQEPLRLLDIPAEILTGVTSHLDPPSLQNLALVNKRLHGHVKDDNTWHRAFVQQFLGIDFQSELHDSHKRLLLRREARTWREEFTARFHLCRKWMFSRNTTIRHIPVHSAISSMHLMPGQSALLCASTRYGIVSRSLPLTGKILPGYLNPAGPQAGIGIGNPNAEFAPNVSTCLLGSDGGTAKVLWGIRTGEVAVTTADKAIDLSRRGINFKLIRCLVDDEHEGPVLDAAWDDSELAVTGGADGRMKLWDTQNMKCLWTSERQHRALVTDPVTKVASAAVTKGVIVGCMRSGDIIVFRGVENLLQGGMGDGGELLGTATTIQAIPVACPVESSTAAGGDANHVISTLYIDRSAPPHRLVLLAAYENDTHLYKLIIIVEDSGSFRVNIDVFGDASFGPISSITPFFATTPHESSFVLVGDRMGCVNVYDWRSRGLQEGTSGRTIPPVRRFEAHVDGSAVTAIQWNGLTLTTGAANGTTHIFDGLTFEGLRNFASPTPRFRGRGHTPPVDPSDDGRVRQILVSPDREVMVVCVGNAVLTWKAGPVGKNTSGGVRGRVPLNGTGQGKKRNNGGKWLEQAELKQNIAESRRILEQEKKKTRKVTTTVREHQASLNELGLNEQEALEYAIMLSREEASGAGESSAGSSNHHSQSDVLSDHELSLAIEEGVFGWDTDEGSSDNRGSTRSEGSDPIPLSASSSNSSSCDNWGGRLDSSSASVSTSQGSISADGDTHFPPISTSPTPINSPGAGSGSSSGEGVRCTRLSPTSAWRTPLKSSTTAINPARGISSTGSSPREQGRGASSSHRAPTVVGDFEDDLRLALELSLAEAKSREHA